MAMDMAVTDMGVTADTDMVAMAMAVMEATADTEVMADTEVTAAMAGTAID
jgi:hypothetical protein